MQEVKTYPLPIARTYIRHWGLKEAARELVQNALDYLKDQDEDASLDFSFTGETLTLTSRDASLAVSTLLLGCTSKADDAEAIGSFGEGYKLALLVLAREGFPVRVLNGTVEWRPVFCHNEIFGQEVLTIEERPLGFDNKGVTFEIGGLDEGAKALVRSTCLRMQPLMRDVIGTPKGHILPSCPGKLYVGGLFVCDTEMTHGYDVNPAYLGLERDRQTVNGFSLKYLTRDMWLATQRWDDIISMLEAEAADVSLIEHSTVPAELAEQAAVRFEATHGAALPVTSQAQANKYRDRGLTTAYTPRALGYVVAQSPRIAARLAGPDPVLSPKQTLENWLHENKRYLARLPKVAFKKLITQAEAWSAERASNRTFF